jgi:alpha-L-fucosidase
MEKEDAQHAVAIDPSETEHLPLSQRIEKFELWADKNGSPECLYSGTTVGYKRIVKLEDCRTSSVRLRITDSRGTPALEQLAFY